MSLAFPHARTPSEDPVVEGARVTEYWAWLEANPPKDTDHQIVHEAFGTKMTLVSLDSEKNADFEAFHMQHSIGHSWTKYSAFGQLWSLRSPGGIPVVTALAVGSEIVHAKEERNARLSVDNAVRLRCFASGLGLTIKPDAPHFDAWASELPMTEVIYLHRDDNNTKEFFSAHVACSLTTEMMDSMRSALDDGDFVPSLLGLPSATNGIHEIVCLKGSSMPPACEALNLDEVLKSIRESRCPSPTP